MRVLRELSEIHRWVGQSYTDGWAKVTLLCSMTPYTLQKYEWVTNKNSVKLYRSVFAIEANKNIFRVGPKLHRWVGQSYTDGWAKVTLLCSRTKISKTHQNDIFSYRYSERGIKNEKKWWVSILTTQTISEYRLRVLGIRNCAKKGWSSQKPKIWYWNGCRW